MPRSIRRSHTSQLLLLTGALLAAVAVLAGYARWALLDSSNFGERTARVVQSEPARTALATAFTDQAIAQEPQLIAARPLLLSGTAHVLGSRASAGVVARGASDLHRAVLGPSEPSLVVDLADLTVVLRAYLQASGASADVARLARLPDPLRTPVAERSPGTDLVRVARRTRALAFAAPLLALLAFAGAVATGQSRRRVLRDIGVALIFVGALVATIRTVLGGVALGALSDHTTPDLARALFDAFAGDLLRWAVATAAAGALLAASAATLLGRRDAQALPRLAWERISHEPDGGVARAARAAGLLVGGLLVVRSPDAAATFALTIVGGYAALLGLAGLLRALLGPAREGPGPDASSRSGRTLLAIVAVSVLLPLGASLAVAATTDAGPSEHGPSGGDPQACNGDRRWCERRLDQIVLPAVHNANSTAADGYLNANNGPTITTQLNMGVRGLLIDALAGQRNSDGVVRTDLTGTTEDLIVQEVGADALASAQRLAGRVAFGPISGTRRLYLCHVLCELGATDALDEFRRIHAWAEAHPRDVLMIFIQDEAPAPMIVDALEASGLADLAPVLPTTGPQPTLGQLIRSGKRVVLLAENQAGAPWYPLGFPLVQETPFRFTRTEALNDPASCAPNRGPATAPMLLVNHWVETYPPNPRNAEVINQPAFILDRARRCMEIRERAATLIAVDFVERGDVVGAARTLNEQLLERTTP